MPEVDGVPRCMVRAELVTKKYGVKHALRSIDLEVREGEFVTIFGPNGAGKSTLVKVLATLCRPTAGKVYIAGLEAGKQAAEARRLIGLVPHQTLLYDDLTAYENLLFYARMYGLCNADRRIREVVSHMGLEAYVDSRARTLSRGTQQRVSIARAMLHDPPILLLDEPETGLDQQALGFLAGILSQSAPRTVIMTTHRFEQGLRMAGRILILSKGRLVYDAPRETVKDEEFMDIYCKHTQVAA